ncbi:hypothetical protein [Methylobacterium sp. 17Sr1-1]|uniref:hypothetical protein n=1 Tax=Methylobacterium sp. 17Sr1-1 TaxID=2202826 RepID=UPI0019508F22|nr:hypothetical protein [Methylobacterium sp. 17Sr1-1]
MTSKSYSDQSCKTMNIDTARVVQVGQGQVERLNEELGAIERDLAHMKGMGKLMGHLAESPHAMDPEVLYAVGAAIEGFHREVEERWQAAVAIAYEFPGRGA